MHSHCNSYFRSLRSKPLKESRSWSHRRAPVAAGSARVDGASPCSRNFMSLRSKPQKSVHPGRISELLLQRARRASRPRPFSCRFAPNRRRVFILIAPTGSCCSGLGARGRREPLFKKLYVASLQTAEECSSWSHFGAPVTAGSARVDASSILALRANRRRVFILVAFQGLLLQRARRVSRPHPFPIASRQTG
jgi:hypothetical protein